MISRGVNAAAASEAIAEVARRVENRAVINRLVGAQLFAEVIKNFETQGARSGRPWAPLKAGGRWKGKGANRYFQTDAKILQDTGNLRNSFAPFSDNDEMGVGARASFGVDYATAHEEGVPERNLPARPMLPTTERALDIASKIYTLHLTKLAQEAGLSG